MLSTTIALHTRDATPTKHEGHYTLVKDYDSQIIVLNETHAVISITPFTFNHVDLDAMYSVSPEIKNYTRSYFVPRKIGKSDTKRHCKWVCNILKLC